MTTLSETSLQQTAAEREAIKSERVRTEAKLEGRDPDIFIETYNERKNKSTGSGLVTNERKEENRSSRESGKGSSSIDEKYTDEYMESCVPDSPNASGNYISPHVSQLLDNLDDTMIKITNDRDNKKYLGMIAEEEEIKPQRFNSTSTTPGYIIHESVKFQSRVNELRNFDLDSTSFVSTATETEISTFNDTESSTSGGTNEPESPLNLAISNSKEVQRKYNSLGRKNSGRNNTGRSIFSVLSNSSLRSSASASISPKNSARGSLSDPEGEFPGAFRPGSPSRTDRILGRTKLSSLSLRKGRSKSTTISDDRSLLSLYLGYDPGQSSPEGGEKPSKVGKILGLTAVEEKILLDKPPTGKSKKLRGTSELHANSNGGVGASGNGFKLPGMSTSSDERSRMNRAAKAGKILGWDDVNSRYTTTTTTFGGPITVSNISTSLVHKGYMTKYKNTKFLSKSWKKRYFILTKNTLYCFKSNESSASQIDNFELTSETAVFVSESFSGRELVLEVSKGQKPWYLQVDNVGDLKMWMNELKRAIKNCKRDTEGSSDTLITPMKGILEDDSVISMKSGASPAQSVTELPDNIDATVDQVSSLPPPPRPSMITSLPPPPRPRSAPNSSCPPSPSSRPISPHSYDVSGLTCSMELEPPLRPSSPVETLSPPRTRQEQNTSQHHERPVTAHSRQQSGSVGSVNSFMESHRSPPSSPNSQRRASSLTVRQSIPIIMPSWISSSSSTLGPPLSNSTSLTPPPRSQPRPPPRVHSSIARTLSPPPITSHMPGGVGPPPTVPLPLPPPPPRPLPTIPPHTRSRHIPPPRAPYTSNERTIDPSMVSSYGKTVKTQKIPSRSSNSRVSLRSKSPPPRFPSVTYPPVMVPLPPPSRPPNLPLPPVPEIPSVRRGGSTANLKSRATSPPSKEVVEFPDDDDLDPDYAEEVEASRRRSQKTEGSASSSEATFFSISDISNDLGDEVNQLPASGLTFVMIEETLGDGELVLDLQYVENGREDNRFIDGNFEDNERMINGNYGTMMPVDMT